MGGFGVWFDTHSAERKRCFRTVKVGSTFRDRTLDRLGQVVLRRQIRQDKLKNTRAS